MAEKINTKEEILTAMNYLIVCLAILVYGAIYAVAAWGWLLLNIESNFLFVLGGWAILFYLFSTVVFPLWFSLIKKKK